MPDHIQFAHPHVTSSIVTGDVSFITAQGSTVLYAAFTAEKGPDNTLRRISSPAEWIAVYGEPNVDKYGQAGVQVVRWLEAGGEAICVRVLPKGGANGTSFGTTALNAGKVTSSYSTIAFGIGLDQQTQGTENGAEIQKWAVRSFAVSGADSRVLSGGSAPSTEDSIAVLSSKGSVSIGADGALTFSGGSSEIDPNFHASTKVLKDTGTGNLNMAFGWVYLLVYPIGRGDAYNNLEVTLDFNETATKSGSGSSAIYDLIVTQHFVGGGEVEVESFQVSLDRNARNSNRESLFVEDVLSTYSQYVRAKTNTENLNGFLDMIEKVTANSNKDNFPEDGQKSDQRFGVIKGDPSASIPNDRGLEFEEDELLNVGVSNPQEIINMIKGKKDSAVSMDGEDTWTLYASVPFASGNGFSGISFTSTPTDMITTSSGGRLQDGKDIQGLDRTGEGGNFATVTATVSETNAKKGKPKVFSAELEERMLKDAYTEGGLGSSEVDRIFNDRDILVDVLLDAAHPQPVKDAMVNLCRNSRKDCMFMGDVGITASNAYNTAITEARRTADTEYAAVWGQSLQVYENYTGKNTVVTVPYLLASKIPNNDDRYGIRRNFVGPRRGGVSGIVPGTMSFLPNEEQKDRLYRDQVNYIEQQPSGLYLATQLTTKTPTTGLSYVNIARSTFRMVRELKRIARGYLQEDLDQDTFGSMQRNMQSAMDQWINNGACSSVDVTISSNRSNRLQNRVNVKVIAVFIGAIERVALTFEVRRR